MKFYLPFTIGVSLAEQLYEGRKKRLEEIGFLITARRIKRLSYWVGSELVSQQVGYPSPGGEIVTAIFESDVGYFVGTYADQDEFSEPLSMHYALLIMPSIIECLEEFDPD